MTEHEALYDITENGINLGAGDYVSMDALKTAAKALEELTLYKQGKLCLVPADIYEKQCKELDELKEKQTAKKLVVKEFEVGRFSAHCPTCGVLRHSKALYCEKCGQKIDWS